MVYSEKEKNPKIRVVVTDVRFENEVKFIQNLGGIIFKINRPSTLSKDMHPSEIELQNITCYNYCIDNTGKIKDMYNYLDKFMSKYILIEHIPKQFNKIILKPTSYRIKIIGCHNML